MRNRIRIFSLALVAVFFTSFLFAQKGDRSGDPEKRATKKTERLTEALELNEAQAAKVKAIHLKYGEQIHAIRSKETTSDKAEKKAAMEQIRTEVEAEMKTVLTAEQFQKFQELPKKGHGKRHGAHGKKGKQHRAAAKAFHDEKVKPILLEQREKLEAKISPEDKALLAELRLEIDQEKAARKAKRAERKESLEKGEGPNQEVRAERRAKRKDNPTRIKVKELVEKYNDDIEPLLAAVEPEIETLKQEWKAAQGKESKKGQGKRNGKRQGKGQKKGGEEGAHANKKEARKYARFLLLDPNATTAETGISSTPTIASLRVYPNPTRGLSQVEYELATPGMITVELHDKEGDLIDTIEQSNKTVGKHKTAINFGGYTVGIYYVVLRDAKGQVVSEKVVR